MNRVISRKLPVCILGLLLAGKWLMPGWATATMVSINRPTVNMRSGPGTGYQVLWELKKGYPLQVIGRNSKWYRVRDFEGDTGWIYAPLTSRKPHMVVKEDKINLRSGPGTRYRVVAQARRGVVFKTIKQVKGWVKVRHENGINAWVARQLVWGW